MTNRIFIISDTHFGHKRICEYEPINRPFATIEEHDEELVYRWNNTVKKNDTIWHLGDVLFSENSFDTLKRLNGIKKLVMGNHDNYPIERYKEHFSHICGSVRLRECIFTHIPVHPGQFGRFKANVHGHMHSVMMEDVRYINVSVECQNLAPMLLDTVMLRVLR